MVLGFGFRETLRPGKLEVGAQASFGLQAREDCRSQKRVRLWSKWLGALKSLPRSQVVQTDSSGQADAIEGP